LILFFFLLLQLEHLGLEHGQFGDSSEHFS
jgi:hypothetical protein